MPLHKAIVNLCPNNALGQHSRRLRYAAPYFTRACAQQQRWDSNRNWMKVGGHVKPD